MNRSHLCIGLLLLSACSAGSPAPDVLDAETGDADSDEVTTDANDIGADPGPPPDTGPEGCTSDQQCIDELGATVVCVTSACDKVGGECLLVAKPDGTECGDPGPCGPRQCQAGLCLYPAEQCDDDDPCTDDSCDPISGECAHEDTGLCECTVDEDCAVDDLCLGGPVCTDSLCGQLDEPLDCDDEDPCTTDACDGGACTHEPDLVSCPPDPSGSVLISIDDTAALNPAAQKSVEPSVAVLDSGDAVLVWRDNVLADSPIADDDILLKLAPDGDVVLVSDSEADGDSEAPAVAGGGDEIHVVWIDTGDLDDDGVLGHEVAHRSWSPTAGLGPISVLPTKEPVGSAAPAVVALDGVAYVVWHQDGNIWEATPGGPETPSAVVPTDGASEPAVTTDGTCPALAWQDTGLDENGLSDIFFRRGVYVIPVGCSWQPATKISEGDTHLGAFEPAIAATSDATFVVYRQRSQQAGKSVDDILLRIVEDGFATGSPILVSDYDDHVLADDPAVTVDAFGDLVIALAENGDVAGAGSDWDILLRKWDGFALGPLTVVSHPGSPETSLSPVVAAQGLALHVVWQDQSAYDGDTVPDWDVIYRPL